MSGQNLLRLSGIALLVGSPVYIISDVLNIVFNSQASAPPPPLAAIFGLIGIMFLIIGMPGILVRQATKAGTLGLIGWIVFFCSALLGAGLFVGLAVFFQLIPQAAQDGAPPASFFALIITLAATQLVGGILLGIATIRARIFSSWIGWLLIVSSLVSAAAFPLEGIVNTVVTTGADLLLIAALGWSGYSLIQTSEVPAQEAVSATQTASA
ncbi:hypothetical protein [Ktedonobacter robiniae]|uniref:DUF4386 family protein n=1 Tax=Ktedonobacter robiniae TaxID=2778365 RepID=A0ABQ3UTS7_9CHLR|nr:hypothetical protein [Ktedonobacter robiniae]GHO56249.1 hypothetical protein KSB_47240 [Ktedonobacter robiniae]